MQSIPRSILDLFGTKKRYVIPIFQRQYVWYREKHWEPLWEDIRNKIAARLASRQVPTHFLGAMVLDQIRTFGNAVSAQIIIDGQQRLTTFQIFLVAFRDVAAKRGATKFAEEAGSYLLNAGLMSQPDTEKFKVWPSKADQGQFCDVVVSGSREKVEQAHPIVYRRRKPLPRPRMVEAYLYFYEALEMFFDDSALTASTEERIEAVFQAVRNDLRVVTIELEGADDPQVIFETLNARGEPLLPSDLLRNYVFFRASQNDEDQDSLYTTYWEQFDHSFWRVEEKQGRLKRARIDMFVQHFLALKKFSEINIPRMFQEYKAWIVGSHPYKTVEEELSDLVHFSVYFKQLIVPDHETRVGKFANCLAIFDVRTIYPLALFVLGTRGLVASEVEGMLVDLESYVVRRAICQLTTKNYNKVFLLVAKKLSESGVKRENLRRILRDLEGESGIWPNDEHLLASWTATTAYQTLGPSKVEAILTAVEEALHTDKQERIVIESSLTVEHVMPQDWIDNWPLRDGTKGKTWLERYQDRAQQMHIESHDEADRRDQQLHTFGNLTLLTGNLNASLRNASYALKKPEILKHSALTLNRYFQEIDAWDEDAILKRSKVLFDVARCIWPYPADS